MSRGFDVIGAKTGARERWEEGKVFAHNCMATGTGMCKRVGREPRHEEQISRPFLVIEEHEKHLHMSVTVLVPINVLGLMRAAPCPVFVLHPEDEWTWWWS